MIDSGAQTDERARGGADARPVGLVLTGGTIAASERDGIRLLDGGPDEPAAVALLRAAWHGDGELEVRVRSPVHVLSEELAPGDWLTIAAAVRALAEEDGARGVVVLHGTDTMAYTAAALSFLLADLAQTVVLTGALVPASAPGSDAARNVADALVAMDALQGGVHVAFAGGPGLAGTVILGTRARKVARAGQAFASVNREPVGEIRDGSFRPLCPLPRRACEPRDAALEERVLALVLHPGLDFDALAGAVLGSGVRGLVIELYPSGTGPHRGPPRLSLTRFIERCTGAGVFVACTIAAEPGGAAARYETSVAITEAGAVTLADMLTETATVKLMWALAQGADAATVRDLMLTPVAGEIDPAAAATAGGPQPEALR
jgi:L-asparaginase/Glu-tRNA(Gln) amidotransferase subunit D